MEAVRFFRGVTEHLGETRVELKDTAMLINDHNAVP